MSPSTVSTYHYLCNVVKYDSDRTVSSYLVLCRICSFLGPCCFYVFFLRYKYTTNKVLRYAYIRYYHRLTTSWPTNYMAIKICPCHWVYCRPWLMVQYETMTIVEVVVAHYSCLLSHCLSRQAMIVGEVIIHPLLTYLLTTHAVLCSVRSGY
jgi:hypothetical protein